MNQVAARRRRARVGAVLMITSAAFWAGGTVLSKAVLDETPTDPLPLLTVQLTASVATLATAAAATRRSTRGAWRVGWTGLLEPGAAYSLGIVGLALTSATNATVLGSLEPMIVPFLTWLVLRHRLRFVQLGPIVVATTGAMVVAASGTAGGSDIRPDLLR